MLVALRLRNSYVARSSLDLADPAALQPLARLRATEDTDVALAVRDWDTFRRAREALVASGAFEADGPAHADLWEFLRHYADAGNQDRLYGPEGEAALASYEFDGEKAGAWLLGKDALEVLSHGPDPKTALDALDAT